MFPLASSMPPSAREKSSAKIIFRFIGSPP
jgi:hypothetical protein